MKTLLLVAMVCSLSTPVWASEQASAPATEQQIPAEKTVHAGATVDQKNDFMPFVQSQDAEMVALANVLERVRKSGEELGQVTADLGKGYTDNGDVDAILLERAQKELTRFSTAIEEAGSTAGEAPIGDTKHFLQKKHSLAERVIQVQEDFSQIALALAGMGNESVQKAIGDFQNSMDEALRAESSLLRTFQNLARTSQK